MIYSEVSKGRSVLYADTVSGVYVGGNPNPIDDVLVDQDFFDALATVEDGETLIGCVNDEWAARIEGEYGIR